MYSGSLFQMQAKLSLEKLIKYKRHIFIYILQEKRTSIEKEFLNWLKECHEQHDKQIHFTGYGGQVVRADLPKQRQTPWGQFKSVIWDNKTFKVGQMVGVFSSLELLGSKYVCCLSLYFFFSNFKLT